MDSVESNTTASLYKVWLSIACILSDLDTGKVSHI